MATSATRHNLPASRLRSLETPGLSALLPISIVVLLVAIGASLVLLSRSGETRVGLLTAIFAFLAASQAVWLWLGWETPEGALSVVGAGFALIASALGLALIVATSRTLGERDRIEALHWDSMEAVRILGDIARDAQLDLDGKIAALLELGCSRFHVDVGMALGVADDRCQVSAIHAPEGFPLGAGALLDPGDGVLRAALIGERPVAVARIEESSWEGDALHRDLGLNAQLVTAVLVGGETTGLLAFASFEPREARFTATEKDLVSLMAHWLGSEIERLDTARALDAARSALAGEAALDAPPARAVARAGSHGRIHVNRALKRLQRSLRRLAGARVNFEMKLGDDVGPARAPAASFESVMHSLVAHAADGMSDGGTLTVETANLDSGGGGNGAGGAERGYVIVTVRDTAAGEPYALARTARAGGVDGGAESRRALDGALPLSSVQRVLQRFGGDLSLQVEAGRGSTFTVFLPRAKREVPARRAATDDAAPTAGAPS